VLARRPEAGHVGGVREKPCILDTAPDDHDWYREAGRRAPLTDFDAVLMRKDPPFDFEYVTATWLLERAEAEGVRVFNRRAPCATIRKSWRSPNSPVHPAHAGRPRWPTSTPSSTSSDDVILKPLDGMGGSQIFRVAHRTIRTATSSSKR
jgi:glutathione synthase